jgi:uncharacterized membrane protein YhaH (DUF805 family)
MNFDVNHLYLTTEGRIGRQSFWIGAIALAIVSVVIAVIIGSIFGWLSFATRLINFIVQLVLAYPAYALLAKRFQDRDKPGTTFAPIVIGLNILYALLALIGLIGAEGASSIVGMLFGLVMLAIGIWILIELGILRGTVGDNAYGPDPVPG